MKSNYNQEGQEGGGIDCQGKEFLGRAFKTARRIEANVGMDKRHAGAIKKIVLSRAYTHSPL